MPQTFARFLRALGTAVITSAVVMSVTPAAPAAAAPPRSTASRPSKTTPAQACGTWVLEQVTSATSLDNAAADIRRALAQPGVTGLSLRVPWTLIDRDLTPLTEARALARAAGKRFSVRFLAGRWTPKRVFDAGAYSFVTRGGQRVPKPFSDSGRAGNPVFEREFDAMVAKLTSWARANSVSLVHLPWYGYQWAEIYNGKEVKSARGYSYSAWLAGHKKLVQLGFARSGNRVAVEFSLSGDWGGVDLGTADLSDAIVEVAGTWSPYVFVQGNGLGRFNNAATQRPIYHAKQMFDGGRYNWSTIYRTLYANDDRYVEIYTSSFTLSGASELVAQAMRFDDLRC